MKQPLSIIRGTTQPINVVVKAPDGSNYVLEEGEVIRFGVKKSFNDPGSDYLIEKELTSAHLDENGGYTLTILPSDTRSLPFGKYYYDIGLQSGANYFNIVECSRFDIDYNITAPEVTY